MNPMELPYIYNMIKSINKILKNFLLESTRQFFTHESPLTHLDVCSGNYCNSNCYRLIYSLTVLMLRSLWRVELMMYHGAISDDSKSWTEISGVFQYWSFRQYHTIGCQRSKF